jgi:signal transduction histidine kinase
MENEIMELDIKYEKRRLIESSGKKKIVGGLSNANKVKILLFINSVFSKISDENELIEKAIHLCVNLFEVDNVTIRLWNGSLLEPVAFYKQTEPKRRPLKKGEGYSGTAFKLNLPIINSDLSSMPEYLDKNEKTRSIICVPIRGKENPLGTLAIEKDAPYFYTEGDLQIVEAMANQLGLVIHLSHNIKEKAVLHDIAALSSHDMKNPLNVIMGFTDLLYENLPDESAELKGFCETIKRSSFRLLKLINSSLDLYKMEKGSYELNPVDVELIPLVESISQEWNNLIQAKGIQFRLTVNNEAVSDNVRIMARGEPTLFYTLISHLMKNAIEAAPQDSAVSVKIDKKHSASPLEISFHNQSPVPEPIRAIFFKKLSSYGKRGGTGLGNYTAKLITRVMGGKIYMETSEVLGTVVRVIF